MNETYLLILTLISAIFMLLFCVFTSIWIYKDSKIREDKPFLWVILVWTASPLIAIILYFAFHPKNTLLCNNCGKANHASASFCQHCGMELTNDVTSTLSKPLGNKAHLIIAGISAFMMIAALAAAIILTVANSGIQYSSGIVYTNIESSFGNTWKKRFGSASSGYKTSKTFRINDGTETLTADIACEEGELLLYLIQGDKEVEFDVSSLSDRLHYPLDEFNAGKITVRIVSNGAKNVAMELTIE